MFCLCYLSDVLVQNFDVSYSSIAVEVATQLKRVPTKDKRAKAKAERRIDGVSSRAVTHQPPTATCSSISAGEEED